MSELLNSDDDLFGDESDTSMTGIDSEPQSASLDPVQQTGLEIDEQLFGADSDEEISQLNEDIIEQEKEMINIVEANLPDLGGSKNNPDLFLLKLPNFIHLDSKPFDSSKYLVEDDLDEMGDEEKLMIENTIRWRLVRWNNNTFSLLIGGELFDVGVADVKARNLFLMNQFSEERFLKTQSSKIMSFTPQSASSMAHRKYLLGAGRNSVKGARTKQFVVLEDPMLKERQAEKAESERLKARKRLEAKQRLTMKNMLEETDVRYATAGGSSQAEYNDYEEDDFVVGGEAMEDASEDELEKQERLIAAKMRKNYDQPQPEPAKSKRLRIIEDSDDDDDD